LGIAVQRLMRKESIQPALGGVFGVAIAAGISWYTGSAKDFFPTRSSPSASWPSPGRPGLPTSD
jgi:hypothetical protein